MYQMHRIFCATPWELEAERYLFHDVVARFNETSAMPRGILYLPVALGNVMDKRPLQYSVDQNIAECRHYILLLSEDWGPPARNFRHDYHLALQCVNDPNSPMTSVAVLAKKQPGSFLPQGGSLPEDLPRPEAIFSSPAEFDTCVTALLVDWLESLTADEPAARFMATNAG